MPLPRSDRATHSAPGPPDRQGLLQVHAPGRAVDGDPVTRISATCSPPADAVAALSHASCCYPIGCQPKPPRFLLLSRPAQALSPDRDPHRRDRLQDDPAGLVRIALTV